MREPVNRSSPSHGPLEIDGLDVEDGLERVSGNMKLYRSLLGQFVAQQADAVFAVRAGLECQDFALVERLVHTLKGVSGNLGAKTISRLALNWKDRLRTAMSGRLKALYPT